MKKKIFILLLSIVFFFPLFVRAEEKEITLYLFHGDGCPHCAEENVFLQSVEEKYPNLKIVKYEVWYDKENIEFFNKVQEALEIKKVGVPTTIIGDTVIIGYNNMLGGKIERAIEYYEEEEYTDVVSKISEGTFQKEEKKAEDSFEEQEAKSDEKMTISIPLFGKANLKKVSLTTAAVVIGFIDGFNPCAMWILLFLISVLIGMKDRKRMWILGLTFLLTSALIYLLLMFSWISLIVKVTTVVWIRSMIALIAIIGGLWNLRSYKKTADSGCEIVDDKKRKGILKKIRQFTSEKSFILALLGVMGLAISVNVVELACSAGLPLIFMELLALNHASALSSFFYTTLYIIFFLIDDFIIFFIAMFTMKVTGISTKYNKYSHLLGGIIMVVIGILLLWKPEWLMFQFR